MDKKQLASSIWNAANEMRGSLDANDYKDFILGFMFYKFLSDKQTEFFVNRHVPADSMDKLLTSGPHRYAQAAANNLGYYIAYDDLFSTWLDKGNELNVADVSEGLGRFDDSVAASYRHLYKGIFDSFRGSIRTLGDNAAMQAKQLRKIMSEIKDVPTHSAQNYDVLGYIYEYLIGKFAANAGKKNGEFYTPHTVALVMAELVANHLEGRDTIEIYDPTSGSGSLLLNIGSAVERRNGHKDKIRYYAQELKQDAYNITRMNLIMRGVEPSNIVTRRADSLGQDWPIIDDHGNYSLLLVDAVVSNPPYSARWDRERGIGDKRFAAYGYAPETKADYAFLLHELYHLKDDGILTIVLPHGVLFRGGDEEKIRRELIEKNHIETVIGFPPNIFYGTGISTIVMVLKKQRGQDDTVQFVDASKDFVKVGTKNELRDRDVRKIIDTVINRKDRDKYSRVVSREEIRGNNYNLNIPRYLDSSEDPEQFDIYSIMFGGIPNSEINKLSKFWDNLPGLRSALFEPVSETHTCAREGIDVASVVANHNSVTEFKECYKAAFAGFEDYLHSRLIEGAETVMLNLTEGEIRNDLFERMAHVPIIDEYAVYQLFADQWQVIEPDLGVIQLEGWEATRGLEPKIVTRTKHGKDLQVQDGWLGTILPFELVQRELLTEESEELAEMKENLVAAEARIDDLFFQVDEEDYGVSNDSVTNAAETAFSAKGVSNRLNTLLKDVTSQEIEALKEYQSLTPKKKKQFEANHPELEWDTIGTRTKTGIFSKASVDKRIAELKKQTEYEEDSLEAILIEADSTLREISTLQKDIKALEERLHEKTRHLISELTDEAVYRLLHAKWITALIDSLRTVPSDLIDELVHVVEQLEEKYATTFADVNTQIAKTESEVAGMMARLTGSDSDMAGLNSLIDMFGVNNDCSKN